MRIRGSRVGWMAVLGALAWLAGGCSVAPVTKGRDVLWDIVHVQCAADRGAASPCVVYRPAAGYALIKDRNGFEQYLLIATDRITGIEDAALYEPARAGMLEAAWELEPWPAQRIGHPLAADRFSLAINSSRHRSQDQLHIHLDCLTVGVHQALAREKLGPGWAPLTQTLANARWYGIAVDSLAAGAAPLALLKSLPGSPALEDVSLFVVGAPASAPANGRYWLLASTEVGAESLQDHLCAIGAPVH